MEFTYLRVADIAMNNELVDGQRQVGVLYGFAEGTVLQAIGLTAADAHKSENGTRYYTADKLNKAMSDALTANATTVKNALEAAARNGGKAMPETDENGHSKVSGLEQGLYLVVETRVPENVTSTCNPFFVSLPMTTIDGKGWNYDVTVYPKNQTGSPNLEKTVREDKNSTGKNTGSLTDIADGYAHTATASVGDVVDYQIISTLPTITSKATSLTTYTFADTMSEGIPTLELVMPVYLGASDSHLAAGAAVLGNTSAPIGGVSTNCVIAGHRGWYGADYFRHIDRLQVGDMVTVTNLWKTLTYTVVDMKIIQPDQVDKIKIQPGRDLLTLITCHPYASGGRQRLVIYCERRK